jgi:curved DNA-binding protein
MPTVMEFVDYYKILAIAKSASESEIKTAYRKLARKYHPDLNPNDKEMELKFKEINEANEVLSDPIKRKKYDEYGKDWKHADEIKKNQQNQRSNPSNQSEYGNYSDEYSDFFESMYGGNKSHSGQTKFRGQDINATLQIKLSDAYTTQKQTLTVNGKNIRITIPAGIENEQVIKINGHGSTGANGGPNGDLYIGFTIINDTNFKREGSNLFTNIDLNLYTAMLGGEVLMNTFNGQVKLKVAPETQSGTQVKLKGKGFPIYKKENAFGDLLVTYQIKLPTSLSEKETALFTELQKIRNDGTQ